jgi:hypothetical protein
MSSGIIKRIEMFEKDGEYWYRDEDGVEREVFPKKETDEKDKVKQQETPQPLRLRRRRRL